MPRSGERRKGGEGLHRLPKGEVIVPGKEDKEVYTVKTPSKPGTWFRRKTRIVGCGNFQKKSDEEVNYSGGEAAEGVRLLVGEEARKKWWWCNGDACTPS